MKKYIISLSIIMIISGIVIGVSGAYLSDKENSTENNFQTGTLDLKLKDATQTIPLAFSNMQPYERKNNYIKIKNIGSLPFNLNINFQNIKDKGEENLSEILQGKIFVERDLLYYLYKAREQELEKDEWLDKFIEKVKYLSNNNLIEELKAEDLISKANELK